MKFLSHTRHVSKILKSHMCLVTTIMDNAENISITTESPIELHRPRGKGE